MTQVDIKYLEDKDGNQIAPITHVNAVRDSNGDTLPEILDRDYPTTSKTPVENSSEVSLCTRGEKYEWNKVGNATDATGASDITSTFKYLLLNGTTGAFETALKSYVEESVRAALGSLLNNLDKGTGVKAVAGIDNNNDLGSVTLSNLASVLGVPNGIVNNSWNIDDVSTTTFILCFGGAQGMPDGATGGILLTIVPDKDNTNFRAQAFWRDQNYAISLYVRIMWSNTWRDWKKVTVS